MTNKSLIREIFNDRDCSLDEVIKLGARGCFDFVDTGSKQLVVAIGDSWTYGWRLSDEIDGSAEDKDRYRISNTFGWHISQSRSADYLNISIPASNNIWMMEKFCSLMKIVSALNYEHIEVIMMMTEYGREFHTEFDFEPEYGQIYRTCYSVDDTVNGLSRHISEQIEQALSKTVELTLATNYVDSRYPKSSFNQLDQSWLEVLLDRKLDSSCLMVGSWVIPKFKNLKEYNPSIDNLKLSKELAELTDLALQRLDIIYNTGYNHRVGYGHPNSVGHRKFAEYYLQTRS